MAVLQRTLVLLATYLKLVCKKLHEFVKTNDDVFTSLDKEEDENKDSQPQL